MKPVVMWTSLECIRHTQFRLFHRRFRIGFFMFSLQFTSPLPPNSLRVLLPSNPHFLCWPWNTLCAFDQSCWLYVFTNSSGAIHGRLHMKQCKNKFKSIFKFQTLASQTVASATCFVGQQAVSLMQGFQMWGYTKVLLINILLSTINLQAGSCEKRCPSCLYVRFFDHLYQAEKLIL